MRDAPSSSSSQLEKQSAELEARYDKIIKEQKETLDSLRSDKMDLVSRAQEAEEKLKDVQNGRGREPVRFLYTSVCVLFPHLYIRFISRLSY